MKERALQTAKKAKTVSKAAVQLGAPREVGAIGEIINFVGGLFD